jgi:hypothetical protein
VVVALLRPSVLAALRTSLLASLTALALPSLAPAPAEAQWTRRLDLASGAYVRGDAPEAIAHAPPGFDPRAPLHLVVFLHGYRGCAEVLAGEGPTRCRPGDPPRPGWDLLARHDDAGTATLFVIAQLAFMEREGDPGRFARPGGFRAFVDEVLAALGTELGARRALEDLASLTVLAHSAAFEATLAILRSGGVESRLRHVVLFDALYSGGPAFLAWAVASPGRRLVSIHGGRGTTTLRTRDLARRARRAIGDRAAVDAGLGAARDHVVTILRSDAPHGEIPARHLAETLRALELPQRTAPRSTTASGR